MSLPVTTDAMPPTGGWKDWDDVRTGDVVRGKDGRAWTLKERDADYNPPFVLLERDDGKTFSVQPTGTVMVLSSATEEMELAKAVVQIQFGGTVTGEQDEHGRWITPVTFGHPGSLIAHIYLLHGRVITTPPEEQDIRTLITTHDQLHRPENRTATSGWIEHVHEPEFYAKRNGG